MVVKGVCLFLLCSILIASSVNSELEVSDGDKGVNCLAEKKPGPCFGYFPKWFFNQTSSKCTEFIYGGCQGNGNNFESEEECKKKCLVHVQKNDDEFPLSHDGPKNPNGPCTTALRREKLLRAIIIHGAGNHFGYTPDCDTEGFYKPMQCKHHMKKCWCVNRWGNRIKSTKERRTRGHPDELDCGQ